MATVITIVNYDCTVIMIVTYDPKTFIAQATAFNQITPLSRSNSSRVKTVSFSTFTNRTFKFNILK